jgi:hypothetical protein
MAMNRFRPLLLGLALTLLGSATMAQSVWKWRDANGTLQLSDQPPPSSVPDKNILSRPSTPKTVVSRAETAAAPASAASVPLRADASLEANKKKLQTEQAAAEAERKKAEKARIDDQKATNCQRAKAQLAMLESGVRVARPNLKGEREFLDDKGRAEEVNRSRAVIQDSCQ